MKGEGSVDAWRVDLIDTGRLVSRISLHPVFNSINSVWAPGRNQAGCWDEHSAPAPDCDCGYRGVEDRDVLVRWLYGWHTWPTTVLSRVRLSGPRYDGETIDPPRCWRAAYAEILEVTLPPTQANQADAVKARYGVPVHVADQWPPTAPNPTMYGLCGDRDPTLKDGLHMLGWTWWGRRPYFTREPGWTVVPGQTPIGR